jgi:hypothetical protein
MSLIKVTIGAGDHTITLDGVAPALALQLFKIWFVHVARLSQHDQATITQLLTDAAQIDHSAEVAQQAAGTLDTIAPDPPTPSEGAAHGSD